MISIIGTRPTLANGAAVPLSPGVRAGDFLFLSGQLGLDEKGKPVADDIASQTRQAIARLEAVLAQAGGRRDQIVKVNVWLTDTADFPAFNQVYAELFPARPPARSTVVSQLLIPGARVEIDAIAYLG
ncbi:RidA family protein [Solimonas sp. SE-A11]|uniref:RidA family protein n=1 Tax=Solimonas sp. SE-A11 TaxID=3054954 RepID=UPI00259CA592|nr:RidA family protein [Solimonas sp. SE-A11]MDM4768785.1 RidA family protein [Solimonas sp. SE-A11]